MKKSFCVLLILAAAIMLFASGCACADITEGLIYDETDNTWAAVDEDLAELAGIMKSECAKSTQIKGTYMSNCFFISESADPIDYWAFC